MQKETEVVLSALNGQEKYDDACKIWICNEKVPEELKNSITRYHMEKEDIMGKCNESDAYHDLMEVVIVRRGTEVLENTLFEYLQGVFTTDFDTINKYVDVKNNDEVKEALKTMCGLGEALENKGIEIGIEKGRLIQLIELVESGDLTEERASEKAGMTLETFKKVMEELLVSV